MLTELFSRVENGTFVVAMLFFTQEKTKRNIKQEIFKPLP